MPTPSTFNPPSANADESISSPTLSKRITGWTSNLLATAVVVILALTVGRQLVSYWSASDNVPASSSNLVEAWPILESCALQFGNSPYQLQRTQMMTTNEGVLDSLSQDCQRLLTEQAAPVGRPTEAELKMIEASTGLVPLAEEKGEWRIFSVDQSVGGIELPTVLGIRDDLRNEQGEAESRLVVWGMALKGQTIQPPDPVENKGSPDLPAAANWTTYVCRSSDQNQIEVAIPSTSRRTMSISDSRGAQLTGFAGGSAEEAKQFFDDWSVDHQWRQIGAWQKSGETIMALFEANSDNPESIGDGQQIRIRLSSDRETLRGLISVSPRSENSAHSNLSSN